MRSELRPHGIGVTTICPGVIDTNIVQATRFRQQNAEPTRARVIAMYKKRAYPAARVADAIVRAIKNGRGVVPVSPEAWLAYYVKRFIPALAAPMSRAMQKQAMG
jgi:short-subunit dehydrogenase